MSRIVMQPSGKAVECAYGDTVLMALEKAGYALPNNCRAGACGECKVKVLAGQFDQGMVLDMALSQEERRQGYGLMCMAKPISDELVIEWGTIDARPKLFPAAREHVVRRRRQTPGRGARGRAAAAAGGPADALLARPVRDARRAAGHRAAARLFGRQCAAPRRRAGVASGARRKWPHQCLGA
jgi:ferredoxin